VRAPGRTALGAGWWGRRTKRLASWLVVAVVAAGLAACSYPTRNVELASLDPREGYRWGALAGGELDDTILIFTASGGGTRATALALSTLRGLERLKLESGHSLADEIDVVSSVSGGSVTAGYFALTGTGGFDKLERDFVRRDGISALIWEGLNPVDLIERATPSRERIDLLIDYLDETLFDEATFADLTRAGRRPLLILNAADMVEGTPFPLTQNRFDLICSDLGRLKLSVGVAASAAVPGAMSPLTLVNYSRCAAQNSSGTWPKAWITNAANSDWYDNPARVRRGRVAEAYALGRTVPPPEGKDFIHLLDGGIADNLGVAEPFRLLSTNEVSPNFFNQISQGKIKRIVFVLVNARSAKASELNGEIATPGITAMLTATVDAAIDNATFGNFERLETLLRERLRAAAAEMPEPLAGNFRNVETFVLPVDFDAIEDGGCRRAFQSIATSWTLPEKEIDALMIAGQALLKSAPKLSKVANALGVSGIENLPDLEDACAVIEEARRKPDKS
jgi:NTE family protein